MNHWNEEEGVFEFKALPADEFAKRSAARDSSDWVLRQLEWCQMDIADGQQAGSVAFDFGDHLIGKRQPSATT